jgi:hypothetical protein
MLSIVSLSRLFLNRSFLLIVVIASAGYAGFSQKEAKTTVAEGKTILWENIDISGRDLYWGPGGREMEPRLKNATFVKHEPGGNNLKYRIKDGKDREWIVKIADEAQPETVAVRLLWGIGYKTEINYLAPRISISKVGGGRYKNVRLEARSKDTKREGIWSWTNNPFAGTSEFEGLKIMMALFNNWDLKDENNVILKKGDELHYVISDLGASFGKLAKRSGGRSGRSVNDPEDYAESVFVKGVKDGNIEFDYRGQADHLIKGIKIEHGRWLADLLVQLSDRQISDAFRAANYSDEDAALMANAVKARITALDRATKPLVAEQ